MVAVALIFPGQGAQKVGMGKEFYDQSPEAKAVFTQADEVLQNGLSDVIFNGPAEKLTSTAYCQPAIFTVSMAALQGFQSHPKFKNVSIKFAAGLSLGEYSALAAAGALSFEDTLKLVQTRSALMEEATKKEKGAMAAIIGFSAERLNEICQTTGAEVANFNSLEQIVITGHAEKVLKANDMIKSEGGKVIPLDVSGAFHSSLMRPAAEQFKEELKKVEFKEAAFPVVSNVHAKPASSPEDIRHNLADQITSSVQWVNSVQFLAGQGIKDFIEIGPGNVLKGLIRKINRDLKVYTINKPADIDSLPFE